MVTITDLSVSIEQKQILQSLALHLESGTVHALMGPNGSGKSTLAYTLMGHPRYEVQSGTLELSGQSLLELSPDKRAQLGIFLAFQHPYEIPGVQVITFLREIHRAVTGLALPLSEFNTLLQSIIEMLDINSALIYRNLNEGFSGGEKKRLEMVQMLLLKPKLVILDEIDSGLDIDALKIVASAINHMRTINPEVTILVITHYQRILRYVQPHYVHILAEGRVVRSGTYQLAQDLEQKGYDGVLVS